MMVREQRGANTPVQSNHVRGRPIGSTKAVAAARRHQKSVDNELML